MHEWDDVLAVYGDDGVFAGAKRDVQDGALPGRLLDEVLAPLLPHAEPGLAGDDPGAAGPEERRLGQVLIDLGYTTPDAVLGALSLQLGVAATRLNGFTVSPAAVQALPEKVARKHMAVPLQKLGTMLQVAIASPTDLAALDDPATPAPGQRTTTAVA